MSKGNIKSITTAKYRSTWSRKHVKFSDDGKGSGKKAILQFTFHAENVKTIINSSFKLAIRAYKKKEKERMHLLHWLGGSQWYFSIRVEIKICCHAGRNNDSHPCSALKFTTIVERVILFEENYQALLAMIVPVDHQALCRYFKIKKKAKKTKEENGTIPSKVQCYIPDTHSQSLKLKIKL